MFLFKFTTWLPIVIGALPSPANASKPISIASISWPATNLPATSPVPPPTISIAPVAAPAIIGPCNDVGTFLNPALANLPPTPFASPIVANSIAAIVTPLPNDLFFKSASFSGFSSIALTFSFVKSPLISSCNNSANVNPVSIAPILPPIKPVIAPNPVPIGVASDPAVAPVAAPAIPANRTSSDFLNDPNCVAIELTSIVDNVLGLCQAPFIKPHIPPPASSDIRKTSFISAEPIFLFAIDSWVSIQFTISLSVVSLPFLYKSNDGSTKSACDQPSFPALIKSLK